MNTGSGSAIQDICYDNPYYNFCHASYEKVWFNCYLDLYLNQLLIILLNAYLTFYSYLKTFQGAIPSTDQYLAV